MIKKVAAAVLGIVVIVLVLASFKPNTFSVTRSIAIQAPAEKIQPLLADFHNWTSWSPWEHLDPNMKRTFSGPPTGKGAVYAWDGNGDVGAGRMEITDMSAPNKVAIKLDFLRPLESHNTTEFTLATTDHTTTVTWTMRGPMPFLSKVMSVFVNMDQMIGKQFEQGLANMKNVAEK